MLKKILFLFLFFPIVLAAQDKRVSAIDSFMTASVDIKGFNGNVLIAKDGNVIYKKSFGYRNLDTKEPLNENTVFEIASVSKQFTAAGILMLVDKGKLSLEDSLRKFFPELPYYNITVKDLIRHTSGLPDYTLAMIEGWDRSKVAFNDDMIKFLAEHKPPIRFNPGERFEYNNAGYVFMASIIEKISGQSFKDYMQENIFTPLGMSSSFVFNTRRSGGAMPSNYALGYVYSDSLQKYVLPDSTNFYSFVKYLDGITGDGIVNSTTSDMLKWDRALKNHTLLSEQMQNEMFSPQALYDTVGGVYYGYGVFLDSTIEGKIIFHGGAWPGYSTNLTRIVDNDLTIIMLSNNNTYTTTMAFTIAHIYAGREFVVPYIHKEAKIDNSIIEKYAGRYKTPNNHVVELVNVNGKLFDRQPGRNDIEMKPESSTKFFSGDGSDVQMEFEGRKAFLIETGLKVEMVRM